MIRAHEIQRAAVLNHPHGLAFQPDVFTQKGRGLVAGDIGAVYLVAPAVEGDPAPLMIDFCKTALARGVTRFVLLSASLIPEGGPFRSPNLSGVAASQLCTAQGVLPRHSQSHPYQWLG